MAVEDRLPKGDLDVPFDFMRSKTHLADPEAQAEMLKAIRGGSVLTWRHLNFNGEDDFTKSPKGPSPFPLARIRALKLPPVREDGPGRGGKE